ncbi:hypothetical protein C9374_014343 [Naegleria lovaniensis]|uniref:Protein kinase domain-containing protein n=1 Tax=Naegleria lovaniensis TaxID=51637 RepID=A0AA88KP16_NAELO|nr:uncharacterized protein C9374_014343 [Naegleria lovaniensis]KAG2388943.1 hypothetical protein C9374_014343 [Naegleria lovaniensis]
MVERKAKFKVEVCPELCDWTRKGKRIKVLSIQKNMMKRQIVVTCHVPRKQVQDSIALDVVSSIKDNDRYEYETYLDEKYPNQYSFIARGGFGHVYKVYDNSIGKDIAVKFMKYCWVG